MTTRNRFGARALPSDADGVAPQRPEGAHSSSVAQDLGAQTLVPAPPSSVSPATQANNGSRAQSASEVQGARQRSRSSMLRRRTQTAPLGQGLRSSQLKLQTPSAPTSAHTPVPQLSGSSTSFSLRHGAPTSRCAPMGRQPRTHPVAPDVPLARSAGQANPGAQSASLAHVATQRGRRTGVPASAPLANASAAQTGRGVAALGGVARHRAQPVRERGRAPLVGRARTLEATGALPIDVARRADGLAVGPRSRAAVAA